MDKLGLEEGYNNVVVVMKNSKVATMFRNEAQHGILQVAVKGIMYECDVEQLVKCGSVVGSSGGSGDKNKGKDEGDGSDKGDDKDKDEDKGDGDTDEDAEPVRNSVSSFQFRFRSD